MFCMFSDVKNKRTGINVRLRRTIQLAVDPLSVALFIHRVGYERSSHFPISGSICPRPLLEDKQRFPDSSFTPSASSGSQSASDARISSGSSWCAAVSDGKHYLQVDLGRLYFIDHVAIFGDSTSHKWVTKYHLNYTVDLVNWKSVSYGTVMSVCFNTETLYDSKPI